MLYISLDDTVLPTKGKVCIDIPFEKNGFNSLEMYPQPISYFTNGLSIIIIIY